MRVLLIQPRRFEGLGFHDVFQVEPIGLEMIAGALEEEEVKILDIMPPKQIIKEAAKFKPQMCGISCSFTVDVDYTLQLARRIKEVLPETPVFVGGQHAAISPEDFNIPYIDAVVCGEGESIVKETVEALKRGSDLDKVRGLVLNHEGRQYQTEMQPMIGDLDTLPYPARRLVESCRRHYYHGFRRSLYALETARGCPYRCKFCSVWKYYRGRQRLKSADRVVEEIQSIPGKAIFVTDDNFFSSIPRAENIARQLLKAGTKKEFIIQARSDDIVRQPQLVDLWAEAGLKAALIGFEEINQENLDQYNKKNTIANNEKALKRLQDKNISVMASFIIDPQYDRSDFQRLFDYVRRLDIRIPSYTVLTPLPGTELYEEMKEKLIATECRLFDFLHAVIPTRLPLDEFYGELASLWAKTYHLGQLTRSGLGHYARYLFARPSNFLHTLKLYRAVRRLFDKKSYLLDYY